VLAVVFGAFFGTIGGVVGKTVTAIRTTVHSFR
jgi:hypothetical protein